jgi:hypothetical protein
MIINNFHNVISIITIQVFHQYYYDEVTQIKYSLSSEHLEFARNHMYLGADRLPLGLIIAPPCPTTPSLVQCAAGNPLGLNNLLVLRSKGMLFG